MAKLSPEEIEEQRKELSNETPQRRKCGWFMILLFLATFGIMIAFLVVGILTEGDIDVKSIVDDALQTVKDTFDDVKDWAFDTEAGTEETKQAVKDICSADHVDLVSAFLDKENKEKFYVLELLNYDGPNTRAFEYMNFLKNDIASTENATLIYDFKKDSWNFDELLWTNGILMEYKNGESYRETYLKNSKLSSVVSGRNNVGTPFILMATLNNDVKTKYAKLIDGPIGAPDPEAKFLLYLNKYKNGDTGKAAVAKYDSDTQTLKSNNDMYAQAWLDVQVTCDKPPSVADYDQIRFEYVIPTKMANVFPDPIWASAHDTLNSGLAEESGSGFSEPQSFKNLYE